MYVCTYIYIALRSAASDCCVRRRTCSGGTYFKSYYIHTFDYMYVKQKSRSYICIYMYTYIYSAGAPPPRFAA